MMAAPEQIAAAWGAWRVRHNGSMGHGPGFVEAIDAALAVSTAATEIEALRRENQELLEALKPFASFYDERHQKYVKRGGSFAAFPDSHPSFDIDADKRELPLGVWRAAARALTMPDIHREQLDRTRREVE